MENRLGLPEEVVSAIEAAAIALEQEDDFPADKRIILDRFCDGDEKMWRMVAEFIVFEAASIALKKEEHDGIFKEQDDAEQLQVEENIVSEKTAAMEQTSNSVKYNITHRVGDPSLFAKQLLSNEIFKKQMDDLKKESDNKMKLLYETKQGCSIGTFIIVLIAFYAILFIASLCK
jgi:hypothetical protein